LSGGFPVPLDKGNAVSEVYTSQSSFQDLISQLRRDAWMGPGKEDVWFTTDLLLKHCFSDIMRTAEGIKDFLRKNNKRKYNTCLFSNSQTFDIKFKPCPNKQNDLSKL